MVKVYNYFYFDVFPKHRIVLSNVERKYSCKIKTFFVFILVIFFLTYLVGNHGFGIPLQTFALVLAMMCFGFGLTNNIRDLFRLQVGKWGFGLLHQIFCNGVGKS